MTLLLKSYPTLERLSPSLRMKSRRPWIEADSIHQSVHTAVGPTVGLVVRGESAGAERTTVFSSSQSRGIGPTDYWIEWRQVLLSYRNARPTGYWYQYAPREGQRELPNFSYSRSPFLFSNLCQHSAMPLIMFILTHPYFRSPSRRTLASCSLIGYAPLLFNDIATSALVQYM